MNRRAIIFAILAVTLVAGLFLLRNWRAHSLAARLASLTQTMNLANAETRMQAGLEILELDPLQDTVRLKLALAYIDLGRYVAARQALQRFNDRLEPHFIEAQIIRADSYLSQAKRIASQASISAEDHVASLLEPVAMINAQLNPMPPHEALSTIIRARQIDVRATLLRNRLRRQRAELAKARSIDIPDEIEKLDIVITDLRQQAAYLDEQLTAACRRAIDLDPQNVVAHHLLFDMHLNTGALVEARSAVETLVQLPSANCDAFGPAADSLIHLETYFSQEPTPLDIELVRRLLDHGTPHNMSCQLAKVAMKLHDGQAQQAISDTEAILAVHRGHPRAICMLADAMVQLERTQEAVVLLQRFHKRVATAPVRYALGSTLLATGRHQAGRQMLRQCLELASDHLPAYLALAQSLADDGHVLDAEPQIIAAANLSPRHRRVMALQAHLAVRAVDRVALDRMLTARQTEDGHQLDGDDLVLVATMVLDNVGGAAQLIRRRLDADNRDFLSLIADAWSRSQPRNRVAVAAAIARTIQLQFDADPLAHIDPPQIQVLARSSPGDAILPRRLLLYENPFLQSTHQKMLELLKLAMVTWPDHKQLRNQSAQLAFWQGWSESSPEPPPSLDLLDPREPTSQLVELVTALNSADLQAQDHTLRKLLAAHPWTQQPALIVLADALEHSDLERIENVLYLVERANPDLATLTAANVSFALGDPMEASIRLRSLLRSKPDESPLPRMACDLLARAHLATGRYEAASGVFANMALTAADFRFALKVAEADTYIDAQRNNSAVAALVRIMADTRTPPYWLDRVLARIAALIPADRIVHLIDTMLPNISNQPLVQLYKANAIAHSGDPQRATRIIARVLRHRPDAPRALIQQARLAGQTGRSQDAIKLYRKLIQQGGAPAETARRELERLQQGPLGIEGVWWGAPDHIPSEPQANLNL